MSLRCAPRLNKDALLLELVPPSLSTRAGAGLVVSGLPGHLSSSKPITALTRPQSTRVTTPGQKKSDNVINDESLDDSRAFQCFCGRLLFTGFRAHGSDSSLPGQQAHAARVHAPVP